MLYSRIVIAAVFLTLGACASSPQYVAADSATDYGHSSRKLAENRYRVNFNGRQTTSVQDTRDFALLRAAELTLAEGYDWFQIVDRETATATTRRDEPRTGFGYERAYYTERSCGLLSCTRTVRPTTTARMSFDSGRPETKHSHSLEIVMGAGEIPEDGNYYDARAVVKSIYETM